MLINGDSNHIPLEDNSVDLIVTDPPYGISFMGKDWDKALPDQQVWKECFRVLKEGKLAFVMCSPRQDVLSRMIISLETAGFKTGYTSIYHTFASGFPKAANISKLIDKRNGRNESQTKTLSQYLKEKRLQKGLSIDYINNKLNAVAVYNHYEAIDYNNHRLPTKQYYLSLKKILDLDNRFDELIERIEAEREIIGKGQCGDPAAWYAGNQSKKLEYDITKPATEEAKKMEGAYVGFQPKPAVEVILVVSKGKTLTWLDDCRIPYQSEDDVFKSHIATTWSKFVNPDNDKEVLKEANQKGRFPANLLVSDDVLNDGVERLSKWSKQKQWSRKSNSHVDFLEGKNNVDNFIGDSGSYSRYFDLDKWYSVQSNEQTYIKECSVKDRFPFIITPKASKSERNEGCEDLEGEVGFASKNGSGLMYLPTGEKRIVKGNSHPTVKPIKLMSYLITLGSRENDLVLDPFVGSGTTYKACLQTHRRCIGIEINKEYLEIAKARVKPLIQQHKLI